MMICRLALFAALAFVLTSCSQGESSDGMAACAGVEDSAERLRCYDSLASVDPIDTTIPLDELPEPVDEGDEPEGSGSGEDPIDEGPDEGKWMVSETVNPIDDSRTVIAGLVTETAKSTFGEPVTLLIRCRSNKTELYINWNEYLGSEAVVLTRIGSEEATTREWSLSTDNEATFYPGNDLALVKSLLATDRFVARVTPYNENPFTAVFDLHGIDAALSPLRDTCGW